MSKPEAETHPELVNNNNNNNNNNPCLDLFYNFAEENVYDPAQMEASCNYVKQVLPLAWSHNPLTALKLVCNLLDGKFNPPAFYTAAFWLHHNHPKTLLCNLGSIFRSFGAFSMSMNIVYHILQEGQEIYKTTPRRGYNRYQLLHKAVKRYKHDRDYQLLHDQSIARKFFPSEEYHKLELGGGHGKGKRAKAKYADRVMVKRLKDEVFPSLWKAYYAQGYPPDEASAVETYLEKVKASCCCSGSTGKI
ncbi:PREDICTED: LOW QUALITY PROTEIN [Prunus dulcis]|uniref:PREDICTED: LOW QUALITY PROTEIN n=1 Tax=Prunus dulcis TaxID=3755 RepID=A0A5E4FSS1_PRUDU|nr:PREDICTED: LOW QUALITY PROTEIN [Prunus dulcis]